MKDLYIFSGLGADHCVFEKMNFSNHKVTFIEWIAPETNESISDYALRLTSQITSEKPILIGLSFGGMIAVEVAKHIVVEKVILIASAKEKSEIPLYYRVLGKLKIDTFIPAKLLTTPNTILNWAFGVKTKYNKRLLAKIIRETNPRFLKWAIRKILTWHPDTDMKNIIHVHGTRDRILPFRNIENPVKILGGGHFMTMNQPDEVSKWVLEAIENRI
ncbi:alpha/beta fold hydrolase [Riemerella columbina]|uniref:alpha/beta fold hydrolase n=1 Tax=Riemerella columbina TaxID=103810 RepID=UPI000381A8C0|nr:alpha/beta hydrolase [Riemerella columbina]